MKVKLPLTALIVCVVLCVPALSGCNGNAAPPKPSVSYGAYDTERAWNDNTKLIKLGYREARGKRVFYQYCVWCHAAAGPSGPSNRDNMTPIPPLMNDGEKLNGESDEYLQNIITLGGSALAKSSLMPPYGKTLSAAEIADVVAFTRAIAQPGYRKSGRSGLKTSIAQLILKEGTLVEGEGFPVSVNGSVQRESGVAPTGTIAFFVGNTQLGSPVPVVIAHGLHGAAPPFWINATPVTIPNAGTYSLTARYSGDSNYADSTTSTTINVLHRTTASISVSPATLNYGGTVKITGVIHTAIPSSNTALKPTGAVTLSGTADGPIKSGVSTTTTADASGNWAIQLSATVQPTNGEDFTITYNSDGNYGTASAYSNFVAVNLPDFSLTANPGALTMSASQNGSSTITITPLTNMTSTVVLTCSDPLLTNVACTISPASIRLANNAPAKATVTLVPVGPFSSKNAGALRQWRQGFIEISKSAAWRLGGSCVCAALLLLWWMSKPRRSYRMALGLAASCVVALAIGCGRGSVNDSNPGQPTTIAITASPTKVPAAATSSLTLIAKVKSAKGVTGTVNFWEDGNDSALAPPAELVDGEATAQVALPSPGTHEIYAQYSGDSNNRASQSSTIDVVATGSAHIQIKATTGPVTRYSSVGLTIQ